MNADTPQRPTMDDDLDQAYARAHALAGDGRGPSAAVRAAVLAEAARIAAGRAGEAGAVPPLVPVAPPVAAAGAGRPRAVNLSSWKLRSGAALCAMLLVGLAVWRFDANGRFSGGVQVALAELRLAQPPAAPLPREELPVPAATAASYPYAAPPPVVVDDPLDNGVAGRAAAAKKAERDKGVVVAQLEQDKERAAAPQRVARAELSAPLAAPAAAPAPADAYANAAPAAMASTAPPQESTTVTITATAQPPQIVTAPPHPPSVLPRRVMLVPHPASAPARPADRPEAAGDTTIALADPPPALAAKSYVPSPAPAPAPAPMVAKPSAAEPAVTIAAAPGSQRVEITGSSIRRVDGAAQARAKAAPAAAGALADAGLRVLPTALQSAAGADDVDALKRLLADPSTRLEAVDAQGRSALMLAVAAGHARAVRLLLAAGADPGHADASGRTPRDAARAGTNAEIAALLGVPR